MLTSRGWLLFITILLLAGVGLAAGNPPLSLIGCTLLGWFLAQWLWFAVRLCLIDGKIRIERLVTHQHGTAESLWANGRFTVQLRLVNASRWSLPFVHAVERVPPLADILRGTAEKSGPLTGAQPLEIRYRALCRASGQVRFDGVRLAISDLQGIFLHVLFIRDGKTLRVLPPLADARGRLAGVKRHNQLPLLGHHAHRRPGTGSELLDLRDYLPGDPPKMIAWKASARRDRLMTKEFESEVPVRCTLFVDRSQAVRVGGPGNNALSRLVDIASAVTQASAGRKDLTGLCVFDEVDVRYLRPARGARHLAEIMNALAEAAAAMPSADDVPVNRLLPLAYGAVQDLYPESLRAENNAFPFWLPWWSPQPSYARRHSRYSLGARWSRPFASVGLKLLSMLRDVAARYWPPDHNSYRRRKQLAAFFSVRYGLAPGGLAILLEDDELFAGYAQRFLAEHQVPVTLPFYDSLGRYQFASVAKIDVLARILLRAIGRGRDNELFVLAVDVLELDERLGKLLAAVKVALARHHQVLVVCPWPRGFPLPPRDARKREPVAEETFPTELARFMRSTTVQAMARKATVLRMHRAFAGARRSFAKLGVPVLCAADEDATALILARLERLRTLERGVPS